MGVSVTDTTSTSLYTMSTWVSLQPPLSQLCLPASMDVAVEGRHKALRIPCPEVSRTTGQTEQPCMAGKRPLEKAEERLSCSFQALPGLGATPAPGPKLGCSPEPGDKGGNAGHSPGTSPWMRHKAAAPAHSSRHEQGIGLGWKAAWEQQFGC